MSENTDNVYVVKTAFEHEGLTYAQGEKYELTPEVVATLPEGSVEKYVPEPTPPAGEGANTAAPATEATPAKPWVGNHTVGRE